MDRRIFLRNVSIVGASIPILLNHSLAYSEETVSTYKLQNVPYFLDTLIPQDSTPSASQLDIPDKLIAYAIKKQNYIKLLKLGCIWLDEQSHRIEKISFMEIHQSKKDYIVETAERSPRGTFPKLFFDHIRRDAFHLYYSDARSWGGLGIDSPPQPMGFLDHSQPPK